tara:strand:- start:2029 stop:2259 length:231 start_codon:yes stop_codon:yes gene_type:complete
MSLRVVCFFIFLFTMILSDAQCAMCKAVAESSQANGSGIANGLNTGILYLMSFPYILLICGFLVLYFSRKDKVKSH